MFELDARLQADTWVLGDFPLCRLLLSRDANYPWLILVPRREGISEIHELAAEDQLQLARETAQLAQRLKGLLGADKMNVAAFGNVVAQLHVHVIARYATDVAWPAPIWGKLPARPYDEVALAALKARLKSMSIEGLRWEEGV
ncbi:HIT domain-containing protein [Pseudomonas sp. DC3000-4b1]|uniref:HIT domain-containing protein n=1 Tax=unclassified Pseudomonas TaxID=196821 RepID=UPI003CEA110B